MGDIGVIRKQGQVAMPMGNNMMWIPGMENNAGSSLVAGVNPQGMGGLGTNPMTQQFEAKTQIDPQSNEKVGVYQGDRYGAEALNQMNRRKLREGETRATNYKDTGKSAGQVAFDRGAAAGQVGHNVGGRMANALGGLAGLVSLANAGAAGQDAFSGGLNAYQMGQVTTDQAKKPLQEGLGGAAARLAGRTVGVVKPEVADPTPPVAVAPPTHTEEEMISYQAGRRKPMTTDRHGLPVEFGSRDPAQRRRAQLGAKHRSDLNIGRDVDPGTEAAPYNAPMGGDVKVLDTGIVAGQGGQAALASGNLAQDRANIQQLNNPPEVAEPTTNNQAKISGDAIANELNTQSKLPGVEDTAQQIKDATNPNPAEGSDAENPAAKAQSGKKQSMTDNSIVQQSFNPMRFIGVVG
jgi:hypothetical protein